MPEMVTPRRKDDSFFVSLKALVVSAYDKGRLSLNEKYTDRQIRTDQEALMTTLLNILALHTPKESDPAPEPVESQDDRRGPVDVPKRITKKWLKDQSNEQLETLLESDLSRDRLERIRQELDRRME